jgi:hypothetical protein
MIENTRKMVRIDTYKPINTPKAIQVEEDDSGLPVAVKIKQRQVIISIQDRWRIDDEWWRAEPISRLYYRVLVSSGKHLILYKDLITCDWYQQDY